jgi:hypothetical protein
MLSKGNRLEGQSGMILIILAMFIVLAATIFLVGLLDSKGLKNARDKRSAEALAEAKAALIGYAITYDDQHSGELYGYLPCPDIGPSDPSGEGAQSVCGSLGVSVLGRFPWKTLDMQPIKDSANECLWYAVSGSYKNNPKETGLNPNTLGYLQVLAADGANLLAGPADPAVAVIFAPGKVLSSQNRTQDPNAPICDGNYLASNYLDTDIVSNINNAVVSNVADNLSTFIAGNDSDSTSADDDNFNDKLVIIRRSEIFAAYCKKYANSLLSNVSVTTNNCDNGGTPKSAKTSCTTIVNYLQYCSLGCKSAAQTIIGTTCLNDMTDSSCQTAMTDLKSCHA